MNLVYSGIYAIYNLVNGKPYIGQSSNLVRRQKKHFTELRTKTHCNQHLQRAFLKYGEKNFVFEVLELVDKDNLDVREQYYLDYCGVDNLYNICSTAQSMRGHKFSDEHRRKIGNANRRRKISDETKRKIGLANTGRLVRQLDKDTGEIIQIFESQAAAKRLSKCKGVGNVLSGRCVTAGGFRWEYVNESDTSQ